MSPLVHTWATGDGIDRLPPQPFDNHKEIVTWRLRLREWQWPTFERFWRS